MTCNKWVDVHSSKRSDEQQNVEEKHTHATIRRNTRTHHHETTMSSTNTRTDARMNANNARTNAHNTRERKQEEDEHNADE
jgi:hypothetical protein